MKANASLVQTERVEKLILIIRGHKVLLDSDLAVLYGVETKVLNQAVRRNRDRFPSDFMFQLTADEVAESKRSQIVTGPQKHRDPRFRPYAFSEQGVAMLSRCPTQQTSRSCKHRDREGVCALTRNARLKSRNR